MKMRSVDFVDYLYRSEPWPVEVPTDYVFVGDLHQLATVARSIAIRGMDYETGSDHLTGVAVHVMASNLSVAEPSKLSVVGEGPFDRFICISVYDRGLPAEDYPKRSIIMLGEMMMYSSSVLSKSERDQESAEMITISFLFDEDRALAVSIADLMEAALIELK